MHSTAGHGLLSAGRIIWRPRGALNSVNPPLRPNRASSRSLFLLICISWFSVRTTSPRSSGRLPYAENRCPERDAATILCRVLGRAASLETLGFLPASWGFPCASVCENMSTFVGAQKPTRHAEEGPRSGEIIGKCVACIAFSTTIHEPLRAGMVHEGAHGKRAPLPPHASQLLLVRTWCSFQTELVKIHRSCSRTTTPFFLSCCCADLTACFHFLP